ncbi:hypothetical protein [Pseudoduganella armeniaca]|uniref:hypothetical protein n=1 Tax=Pseudoduganella armeniaca TaxID=2072590 RepID=UPI001E595433|nr:hypothetical protein [Pseudoduganella armeniaca]
MNDKNITGDLRLAWRALLAEPAYAAIAILGLGIGLAACLLLLGYVRHAWQYNAEIAGVDRLYLVKLRNHIDPNSPWFDQGPLLLRGWPPPRRASRPPPRSCRRAPTAPACRCGWTGACRSCPAWPCCPVSPRRWACARWPATWPARWPAPTSWC